MTKKCIASLMAFALFGVGLLAAPVQTAAAMGRPVVTADNHLTAARDRVIARAQAWVDQRVVYNMDGYFPPTGDPRYREDCSGFVSMAWELSSSLTTSQLASSPLVERISTDQLQEGDILLNPDGGGNADAAHAVIFYKWVDPDTKTAYQGYEETPPGARKVANIPYPYWRVNLAGEDNDIKDYAPYRLKRLDVTSQPTAPVDGEQFIQQSPNPSTFGLGQSVSIYFTELNTGTTTWSDTDQYALTCLSNCFGVGQVGFNGGSVPPGGIYQFDISFPTSISPGTYRTVWALKHGSAQFGKDMWIDLIVASSPITCEASSTALMAFAGAQLLMSAAPCPTAMPTVGGPTPVPSVPVPPTPVPSVPVPPTPVPSVPAPNLYSPGNGWSYAQSTDISLVWNTSYPQGYCELWGAPYSTLNFGGWQSATSIHIGQMWPGTFSWHCKVRDSSGNESPWSATWTFTINNSPTPTPVPSYAVTLLSPGNGSSYAQSTSITLSWTTNYPQSYCELWGAPYSTLNFGGWTTAHSIAIGQMWPGTFSWHCKARDSSGVETGWSPTWTFTIQ